MARPSDAELLALLLHGSPCSQILLEVAAGGDLVGVLATRAAYASGLLLVDDVAGRAIDEILRAASARALRDGFHDSLRLNEPVSYEEFASFGSREAWAMTTLTPLFDDRGVPAYIVASFLDLDFVERTESALSQLDAGLRRLVDASSDAILVGAGGSVAHANAAAAAHFGATDPCALVGRAIDELVPDVEAQAIVIPLPSSTLFVVRKRR